jgi:hypothetical protein
LGNSSAAAALTVADRLKETTPSTEMGLEKARRYLCATTVAVTLYSPVRKFGTKLQRNSKSRA